MTRQCGVPWFDNGCCPVEREGALFKTCRTFFPRGVFGTVRHADDCSVVESLLIRRTPLTCNLPNHSRAERAKTNLSPNNKRGRTPSQHVFRRIVGPSFDPSSKPKTRKGRPSCTTPSTEMPTRVLSCVRGLDHPPALYAEEIRMRDHRRQAGRGSTR